MKEKNVKFNVLRFRFRFHKAKSSGSYGSGSGSGSTTLDGITFFLRTSSLLPGVPDQRERAHQREAHHNRGEEHAQQLPHVADHQVDFEQMTLEFLFSILVSSNSAVREFFYVQL